MPQFINISDTVQLSPTYESTVVRYQPHIAFVDSLALSGTLLTPLLSGPSVVEVLNDSTDELIDMILFVVEE